MLRRAWSAAKRLFWFAPGFLLWASFPPVGERTDVYFALAPLLWLSRKAEPGKSFRKWFANGFLFWILTLSWMPAIVKNGGPWPLVVLGWFVLAAYCSLFFGAFGWLSANVWAFVRPRSYPWRLFAILAAEPVLWCGTELLRCRLFGGFAWNQLGVAPVNAGFGSPAVLGGVALVGATVILANGTLASIAERMASPSSPHRALRAVETVLPLAAIWAVYAVSGRVMEENARVRETDGAVSVGLVQRDFPCVFRENGEDPRKAYSDLAGRLAPFAPDLLVLPESAFSEVGPIGSPAAASFARWLMRESGASAVLGGGSRIDGGIYNSAAIYGADGSLDVYDKNHLVPFGEYIPFDKDFPFLQRFAPVGSCVPGEPKTLGLDGGGDGRRLGVAICYEDTDSALVRSLAARGAGLLVFVTNDSWFSDSAETVQHAWQATARSIETGLYAVRVGNNGVTGVVSPDGTSTWLADASGCPLVDARGAMFERVPCAAPSGDGGGPRPPATPYAAVGDAPLASAFALLILSMILVKYKNAYEKRRAMPLQIG